MQKKTQEELRTSALIMLTAKATEECSACLEGYRRAAEDAGATQKEIEFALAAGKRARANIAALANAAPVSPVDGVIPSGVSTQVEILKDEERAQFLGKAMEDENVRVLDDYFRKLGYEPLATAREAIQLQLDERNCTEVYLPYTLNGDHDKLSWISYHLGKDGVDLIGLIGDFTQKERVLNGDLLLGQMIQQSLIVENGMVVQGHACDLNCIWNQALDCCGGAVFPCLADPPALVPCLFTVCGVCTVWFCFRCGCC